MPQATQRVSNRARSDSRARVLPSPSLILPSSPIYISTLREQSLPPPLRCPGGFTYLCGNSPPTSSSAKSRTDSPSRISPGNYRENKTKQKMKTLNRRCPQSPGSPASDDKCQDGPSLLENSWVQDYGLGTCCVPGPAMGER